MILCWEYEWKWKILRNSVGTIFDNMSVRFSRKIVWSIEKKNVLWEKKICWVCIPWEMKNRKEETILKSFLISLTEYDFFFRISFLFFNLEQNNHIYKTFPKTTSLKII